MKKKVKQKKENSERWLLTYSDMITLLLALFILLYSMSNVDQAKYEELAASLNAAMGNGKTASVLDGANGVLQNGGGDPVEVGSDSGSQNTDSSGDQATVTPVPTGSATNTVSTEEDMSALESGINDILKTMEIGDSAGTVMDDRGLTITFADDVFFDSGQAVLKDSMKKGLNQIAKLLNRVNNPILVEGFTDNVPISNSNQYTSNWQLSAARAAVVVDYLVEQEGITGTRISAVGYGEYHPIASNDTVEGRNKNRRVNITVLYNDETGMEFK